MYRKKKFHASSQFFEYFFYFLFFIFFIKKTFFKCSSSSSSQPEKKSQWLVDPVQSVIHLHSYITITTYYVSMYIQSVGILYQNNNNKHGEKDSPYPNLVLTLPRHHSTLLPCQLAFSILSSRRFLKESMDLAIFKSAGSRFHFWMTL